MSLKGGIPKTLSRLQKDVADADVIQRADVFADGRSQLRLFAGKADGDVELEAVIADEAFDILDRDLVGEIADSRRSRRARFFGIAAARRFWAKPP